MKRTASNELLAATPINAIDASRLVLECIEELGDAIASTTGRQEVISMIRAVIRKGSQAVKAENHTVTLEHAAWASVEARSGRRPVTLRDLRHFVRRILRVEGAAQLPLRAITISQCRHILSLAFGNSPNSYKKGRAILHSIFQFGMRREWCDSNPVSLIETPRVEEKPITPLSVTEIKRLQNTAGRPAFRDMQLPLQLMLFCGVRPTEITRIRPKDIHWQEQELLIRPTTSKTGGGRIIPLRNITRRNVTRIAPKNWQHRWRKLRQAAGFTTWQADACRHTFASYHAAYFRDLAQLQMEMGHRDLTLLRTRYISPVGRKNAQAYWASGSRGAGGMVGEVSSMRGG